MRLTEIAKPLRRLCNAGTTIGLLTYMKERS
jgi:hypothetical protein